MTHEEWTRSQIALHWQIAKAAMGSMVALQKSYEVTQHLGPYNYEQLDDALTRAIEEFESLGLVK